MKHQILLVFLVCYLSLASGCAPSSTLSEEGFVSSALGAAAGTGVGYAIGQELGKTTENMLVSAGVGAGLGLMVGGILHEANVETARQKELVVREAKMISKNQFELDRLRENICESTTWGGNEVKPWEERYWGNESSVPYEGSNSR